MAVGQSKGIDVSSILDKFHEGETAEYDFLCAIISGIVPVKASQLTQILLQVRDCMILLDISTGKLTKSILNIKLEKLEAEALSIFSELIVALAGINTAYLNPAINTCVLRFGLEHSKEAFCPDNRSLDEFGAIGHETLHRLIEIYPLASLETVRVLEDRWPNEHDPPNLYLQFFRNICVLYIHAASLRKMLLPKMIEKLMKLDLMIQKANQGVPNENIFAMDSEIAPAMAPSQLMDYCLQYLFVMLRDHCSHSQDIGLETFEILTSHCEEGSMVNAPLNSVPFIYLYFLNFQENWLGLFLKRMWAVSVGRDKMFCKRSQRRIAFMAALIARAKYASHSLALYWLREWVAWAESYLNLCSVNQTEGCLTHGLFYAVCQAVFFIVTFRFKDLNTSQCRELRELNLEKLTHSRLNPLRFAPQHLITAFANITRSHQLVYCYHVIERNRRLQMYDKSSEAKLFTCDNYFPLDPCELPGCSNFINELYRNNQMFEKDLNLSESEGKWNRAKRDHLASGCSEMDLDFIVDSFSNDNELSFGERMIDYGSSPGFKNLA